MIELVFLGVGVMLGFLFVGAVFVLAQLVYVGRPNQLLILSGRSRELKDGSKIGFRVIHGGMAFRNPLFEKVDQMALATIPIELSVVNAYSRGGIPLGLRAIANVKVSSDPGVRNQAIERFLGRDPAEIRQVARESLEGHLRGIIARMTPEQVNEDRLMFAQELVHEADEDFDRLGLALDTLKVLHVSDDVAYLDSLGREQLANVKATAEIAESTAKADAEEAEAKFSRSAEVAREQAETMILQRQNGLRKLVAELEVAAKSQEERALQAGLTARAKAEERLQEVRARLENLRLQADIVLPAAAQRQASEMRARADAAQIAADGQAMAQVLTMLTAAWVKAGPDAKDIFLIQQLETVLSTVTDRVRTLQIGEVNLLDGGDGLALPSHIASLPATVAAVLKELRETTGIDVTGTLVDRRLTEVSR